MGPRKHVVTAGWWTSAIPYGATLRLNAKGDIEFKDDTGKGNWVLATGADGALTKALFGYKARMKEKTSMKEVDAGLRALLINPVTKTLVGTLWDVNDFGRWGWQLLKHGHGTPYFVHTTPLQERDFSADPTTIADLTNSHGCIHIDPIDREEFIAKGYLNAGTEFEVRPYSESGPP